MRRAEITQVTVAHSIMGKRRLGELSFKYKRDSGPLLRDFKGDFDPIAALQRRPSRVELREVQR